MVRDMLNAEFVMKGGSSKKVPFLRHLSAAVFALPVLLGDLSSLRAEPEPAANLRETKKIHALVIGIDQYQHLPELRGAVADAKDISSSLQKAGVRDVVTLLDEEARRDRILSEIDKLKTRVEPGDLVILSLAGHGAQESERADGQKARSVTQLGGEVAKQADDDKETVFLLAGFNTARAATRERILDQEFSHIIRSLEEKGARVLFVADSCSGGGLARSVDQRADNLTYRAAPKYEIEEDDLKPISTASDASVTKLSFDRSIFLAAVDKYSKAPEIKVPGVEGYRGALSYALARAIEGAGDLDGDGNITIKELFDYTRDVTYQLSDQRQNIVSLNAASLQTNKDAVFSLTRSVRVADIGAGNRQVPAQQASTSAKPLSFDAIVANKPIRMASLDEGSASLKDLKPSASPFQIVSPADADFIWDPRTGDVISAGDVVARKVVKSDLPHIADRATALLVFKQFTARAPQDIRLLPDSQVHRRGTVVEVKIQDIANRALFLFNVAGDGTVQMLYPLGAAARIITNQEYRAHFEVREPFGSDQVIAVTAPQRLPQLEQDLQELSERRSAAQVAQLLSRYANSGLRFGSVSIFTAP